MKPAIFWLLVYFSNGTPTLISEHTTERECNLEILKHWSKKPICTPTSEPKRIRAYATK